MQCFRRSLFVISALLLSWLLMQAIHELGHVAAALVSGGTVERVVLHPLSISRTDVDPNPQPLVVAWGGPLFGSLAPLALWGFTCAMRQSTAWLARFFAGFCLLANGLYLSIGSFDGIGDAGDLVRHGSPMWTLWLFGLCTAPAGLAMWNGVGKKFGIGNDAADVSGRAAFGCAGFLAAVAVCEALFTSG